MGLCLRAVALNGCNLHWLRSAAGVPYRKGLTHHSAGNLAPILGCMPDWLGASLPTPERLHGRMTTSFLGQRFTARNHLRRGWPQVCARCVHRDGFCRSAWELSLVTVCVLHRCTLVDRCAACGAPLRWDRPDVAICQCGRPIQSAATQASGEDPSFDWSQILQEKLTGEPVDRGRWAALGLPDHLHELSADGFAATLYAFGACAAPFSRIASSASSRLMSTSEWTEVGQRAWSRLQQLGGRPENEWHRLVPIVGQSLLGRAAQHAATTADALVARHLLRRIFGAAEASRFAHDDRQLELFD